MDDSLQPYSPEFGRSWAREHGVPMRTKFYKEVKIYAEYPVEVSDTQAIGGHSGKERMILAEETKQLSRDEVKSAIANVVRSVA